MDDEGRFIGQQIRTYRRIRGYSQQVLADKVGIGRSALGNYETGLRPVDSRELLYGFATALEVTVGDLTGHQDDKVNPNVAAFHAAVPRIEAALMSAGEVDGDSPPRPLSELVADSKRALTVRMAGDYSALAVMLPSLLTDLYRHTLTGSEQEKTTAWSALTSAALVTALETKALGHVSLAWNAALATNEAATNAGDPAGLAAAEFVRSQVLMATPGSLNAALSRSAGSADKLQRELTSPSDLELYGMLQLQAALASAVLGKDPSDHLNEAAETARSSGDGHAFELAFGAANVDIWRMSVALEQRQAGNVIEIARGVNPSDIATENRRARFHIELGRAHALEGDYTASMHALLQAEHVAPQHVRSRTVVRELIGHMLRRAKRDLVTGDLGKLAKRVGATSAPAVRRDGVILD